jgi:hypothetical protein
MAEVTRLGSREHIGVQERRLREGNKSEKKIWEKDPDQ